MGEKTKNCKPVRNYTNNYNPINIIIAAGISAVVSFGGAGFFSNLNKRLDKEFNANPVIAEYHGLLDTKNFLKQEEDSLELHIPPGVHNLHIEDEWLVYTDKKRTGKNDLAGMIGRVQGKINQLDVRYDGLYRKLKDGKEVNETLGVGFAFAGLVGLVGCAITAFKYRNRSIN